MASHGKIGSRPTHSGGTSRSCVISRQCLPVESPASSARGIRKRGRTAARSQIRKVGDDDHGIVDAWPTPPPGEHALTLFEIDVDELRVVDGKRIRPRAKVDQAGAMLEYAPAPPVLQAIEVHWVDLLLRMDDRQVMLVGELFAGENHRDADGGHQADEGELDSPLRVPNAIVVEKIV